MTSDELYRAAYGDLTQAAAMLDRHGGQLSEDPEMVAHFRAAGRPLAALVNLLCDRIGAYRPDQRQT